MIMSDANIEIQEFHNLMVKEMHIPSTLWERKCACGDDLVPSSIRNIGLCLNARNFGDISVEILCSGCSRLETLYFKESISNIVEFSDIVNGIVELQSEPLIEEKMYSAGYNNLMQEMHSRKTTGEKNDIA